MNFTDTELLVKHLPSSGHYALSATNDATVTMSVQPKIDLQSDAGAVQVPAPEESISCEKKIKYSEEHEAKISDAIRQTRCSRQFAIEYLEDNGWNLHGAVCDICADQSAEQMNAALGY